MFTTSRNIFYIICEASTFHRYVVVLSQIHLSVCSTIKLKRLNDDLRRIDMNRMSRNEFISFGRDSS